MHAFFQHLIDSITLGSLYAVMGLSIALVFGIMRLVNFAQGDLVMVGAYGSALFSHAPWVFTLIIVLVVPILFALIIERIAFRPVRMASDSTLLVTSFAVSYLLESLVLLFLSATPRGVNLAPALGHPFHIAGLLIPWLDVATVGSTMVLLVGLSWFLSKTRTGVYMRAAAEDFTTARLMGVRANRVIAAAFAISGLLTGVTAYLTVAQTGQVYPAMGVNLLLVAFVATTIGGLGSLSGAVLGGYILGAITIFIRAYLPAQLASFTQAFTYLIVILILLYRPQGLLTSKLNRTRV
ncbi:MAG: branched-chain amino acid ABC transporter permease [Actinobacteria bacterium]|nr:branched-chain amino acid ABC transporter permease [Actinomycetota bacterium]